MGNGIFCDHPDCVQSIAGMEKVHRGATGIALSISERDVPDHRSIVEAVAPQGRLDPFPMRLAPVLKRDLLRAGVPFHGGGDDFVARLVRQYDYAFLVGDNRITG
jgi:hypothetical protein